MGLVGRKEFYQIISHRRKEREETSKEKKTLREANRRKQVMKKEN